MMRKAMREALEILGALQLEITMLTNDERDAGRKERLRRVAALLKRANAYLAAAEANEKEPGQWKNPT